MIKKRAEVTSYVESDEVIVSKEMLKSIGGETRIAILKALKERQKTQSELAQELKLSPATILEHMANLEKAGLIELNPEYNERKWKYYRLTKTARPMVEGRKMSIMILLTTGSALITGGLIVLNLMNRSTYTSTQTGQPIGGGGTHISNSLSGLEGQTQATLGIAAFVMILITLILACGVLITHVLNKKRKN